MEMEHMKFNEDYDSLYLRSLQAMRDDEPSSTFLFEFKDNVSFHLFTTEAPCGDASMAILINSKPPDERIPWSLSPSPAQQHSSEQPLLGRGHFSHLGIVRRKPARGDAANTLSKSCTDKLALKQFLSIMSFPADIFVQRSPNASLKSLIVYHDQHDAVDYERAFSSTGRLAPLASQGTFFDISVLPSSFPRFEFAKQPDVPMKASNISTIWVRGPAGTSDVSEILLNGVKQGYTHFSNDPRKESAICRKQLWILGRRISALTAKRYTDAKNCGRRTGKRELKDWMTGKLQGWVGNEGDGDWGLD
jgi:tRNA-specific adenosine deaminase 1